MDERKRWQRVEQIFHAALERDASARADYVRRECAGDDKLRERVEALLKCDNETSPIDRAVQAEPPECSFGRYRLISKLGEGGMGAVYLARDTQLNREVAIKTLPLVFAIDAERRRRFLREARAASALSHPNIVPVYDFGRERDVEYYVMEYVSGKPLDRLIPRTGLKLEEALAYAIPIAGALQAAHEAGIVHRDIKPANIILDERGVPKVLDFGIAKLGAASAAATTNSTGTETAEGIVIGTAAYMSPEQAEGRTVDARSDIFSFGSLLYEMVTGRRAFERGSNASTVSAILRDNPPRANSLVNGIPQQMCGVMERCLVKDPAQRYQHMADVLVDLDRVRAALGHHQKRRVRPGSYAVAAVLLIVCSAAAWWFVNRRKSSPNEAAAVTGRERAARDGDVRLIPLTSYPGQETSPSFSPDGSQVAFSLRERGQLASHIFIKLIGQNDAVQLTRGADANLAPAWSPDGRWIAFLRYSGQNAGGHPVGVGWTLMLMSALGGPTKKIAELDSRLSGDGVSWHPDGKSVAAVASSSSGGGAAIHIITIADGTRRQLTRPEPGFSDSTPAFAPDGKSVVFSRAAYAAQDLYMLELNEDQTPRRAPRRLTVDSNYAAEPVWMPDGRSVLFSKGSFHTPALWRLWIQPNGSEPRSPQKIPAAGVGVRWPAVSSKGLLAFAVFLYDADIWRVDLAKGAAKAPGWERHSKVVASTRLEHEVRLSPDGKRLAFVSERSGNVEIWVSTVDGKDATQLTFFDGSHTAGPHWSPDGQWISFSSLSGTNMAVYMIPAQGGAMKRVTDPRLSASGGSWTPDGRWIYCEIKRQLWKIPVNGGSPVQITRNGGGTRAENPDGRVIYYTKDDTPLSRLYSVPADGGEEREILPAVFAANFAARKDGIYFVPSPEKPAIWFFSFADRKASMVARLKSPPAWGMDVSKDGRLAFVPEFEEDQGGDLLAIENFH